MIYVNEKCNVNEWTYERTKKQMNDVMKSYVNE